MAADLHHPARRRRQGLPRRRRHPLRAGRRHRRVVGGVPGAYTGAGAPYDLSGAQSARWGQTEPPTDATAVYPPTQIPDGNQATGVLPSSFERATVSYLDTNARHTNAATPGGYVATTWFDQWSHTVATLTAGNRKNALDASGSDAAVQEAPLAADRTSYSVYSWDGRRLLVTRSPAHTVTLAGGSVAAVRDRTEYSYDEGAPSTGAPFDLVTTTRGVYEVNETVVLDSDAQTSTTQYDWTLRQPTVSIVDPGGLALATRTGYDPVTGLVVSQTAPAGGTATNTPATRQTVHYRTGAGSGHAECDLKPEWANLPCRFQPGGQAVAGPDLPVTVEHV